MEDLVFQEGPDKQPLVKREGYTVIRISLGNGTMIPPHMADHSAFFLVLKGTVIFTAGERGRTKRESIHRNGSRPIERDACS